MRWWGRNKRQQPQDEGEGDGKSGKSKAAFSPLAWLSKLTARSNAAASSKPKAKSVSGGFPSCFHERATPSPASQSSPAEPSSPATAAPDIAPRRLSVGDDGSEAAAAAARQLCRRRHFSIGGDRDLPPLGHLAPFSRSASPPEREPATPPAPSLTPIPPPPPSDTADEEKRPRSRQRHRRGGGRRSFTGRTPGARVQAAVRVRSPRCAAAAVAGLEGFALAVVRRTSDPRREFRDSMVEMIASRRIGRPEELKALLACYLSLNADEHHDCIVKVFRQVWFDLNPARRVVAPAARLIKPPCRAIARL